MKNKNFGPTLIRQVRATEQNFRGNETSLTVYEQCSFSECDLGRAKFYSCVFSGCSFSGANLASAKFLNCRFENCCFLGANLYSCELDECLFVECSFFGANGNYVFTDKHTLFDNCAHLERLSVSPFFEQPEVETLND